MKSVKENLHAHTFRCHHASGTEREYLERAAAHNMTVFGFSEHIPYVFPNGHISRYRMAVEDTPDYFDTLTALKNEYAGKLDVKIGFECEYYSAYFTDMLSFARESGAEYLILGEHFINADYDEPPSSAKTEDINELIRYTDACIEGMSTGFFTYLAHPDLKHYVGTDKDARDEQYLRLCEASEKYGVPLEINMWGIYNSCHYPAEDFFRIAGKSGAPVVLGFDAHRPDAVYDENLISRAFEIAENCGIKPLDHIEIKSIR